MVTIAKAPTRKQLETVAGKDPELIRALERLFDQALKLTPTELDSLTALINANTAAIATKADASNVLLLDNATPFTPDADYEPATKKYVDDQPSAPDLTQVQAENPASTVFGNVSGQRIDQARLANIVGTVAQSGGLPTGANMESGSNANGNYVRFADGTQICWLLDATFSYAASDRIECTWTYPATFASAPAAGGWWRDMIGAAPNANQVGSVIQDAPNGTSGTFTIRRVQGATDFAPGDAVDDVSLFAIGRWF